MNEKDTSLLCIIPARGGSKRIPHKNIALFKGLPMIAYSISAVEESDIASEIMVSTDDENIADISKKYGANVPFYRSKKMSNDTAGIVDVLLEVIAEYVKRGKEYKYIACVLATAPLIQSKYLKAAFKTLQETEGADSICSVEAFSYPPQRGLVIKEGNLEMLHPENYYVRSQDLQSIYHDCGQFFIFSTEALLRDKKLYTQNAIPFFLKECESQDIDNWEDWKMAEMKYDLLKAEGKI